MNLSRMLVLCGPYTLLFIIVAAEILSFGAKIKTGCYQMLYWWISSKLWRISQSRRQNVLPVVCNCHFNFAVWQTRSRVWRFGMENGFMWRNNFVLGVSIMTVTSHNANLGTQKLDRTLSLKDPSVLRQAVCPWMILTVCPSSYSFV